MPDATDAQTEGIRPVEETTTFITASVPKNIQIRLYTSHTLSTWNSRTFEFASILFLAAIYPSTLRPMSIYALVRSAAAVLLAQPVGSWIDTGDRLAVVRVSIIGQRVSVAASCALFLIMRTNGGLFALVVILACVEKVCAVMNTVAVERDWVVAIAETETARRELNARMRRIDLACKLLGPLAISLVALASNGAAIWTVLGMNVASVAIEYVCIEQVYRASSALIREPATRRWLTALPIPSLPFYFRHSAFLPSFALSLLYFTVLSFSGQMITYLVSVGYTPLYVGVARTASTAFELSATWAAPRLMRKIGVVRGGIWSLSWQMIWLAAGLAWFYGQHGSAVSSATGLAVTVAVSRIGLWGYDLCAQNIVQNEVDGDHRGSFSTVEAAFQNLFEMLSYVMTIVFSRPEQFQWPVVMSIAAVYAAGGLYACFVRRRRGHLFHAPCGSKE